MFGTVKGYVRGAIADLRRTFQETQKEVDVETGRVIDTVNGEDFEDTRYNNKAEPAAPVWFFVKNL